MKRESQQGAGILDGYATEEKFAADNHVSKRTVAEYRKRADGLPYTVWGGKVYIPVEQARQYLAARVERPNPSRRKP
jgi:hypothetical protein